ncbi:hypothetical protein BKA62DRAFT_756522 [Auriculariales sp. MPI-PUGE-AT-0066]|nr:hypothetical protein BKA62DRAFT_756522 [Auriculariales sp. MPI-PUGE-AT-0066]
MPALPVPLQILKEEDVRFFQGRFTGWIVGPGLMSFEWETILKDEDDKFSQENFAGWISGPTVRDELEQHITPHTFPNLRYLRVEKDHTNDYQRKWTPMADDGSIWTDIRHLDILGSYSDHDGNGYQLLKLLLNRTRLSLSVLHLMPLSFGTPPAGIDGLIPEMTGLRTLALGDIPLRLLTALLKKTPQLRTLIIQSKLRPGTDFSSGSEDEEYLDEADGSSASRTSKGSIRQLGFRPTRAPCEGITRPTGDKFADGCQRPERVFALLGQHLDQSSYSKLRTVKLLYWAPDDRNGFYLSYTSSYWKSFLKSCEHRRISVQAGRRDLEKRYFLFVVLSVT